MSSLPSLINNTPGEDVSDNYPTAEVAEASEFGQGSDLATRLPRQLDQLPHAEVFQQLEELREILQGLHDGVFVFPEQLVDLPNTSGDPRLDFGLGGGNDNGLFANVHDSSNLSGLSEDGGSSTDGLPDNAPPSGFGAGGIASTNGMTAFQYTLLRFPNNSWQREHRRGDGGYDSYAGGRDDNGSGVARTSFDAEGGGAQNTVILERNNDGSSREVFTDHATGDSVTVSTDADGNTHKEVSYTDENETHWEVDSYDDVKKSQDPDGPSNSALADWAWRQHKLGRHAPQGSDPPITSLVNPGDPDYEGAYAGNPSISARFTDSIAINPDPTSPSNSGSTPNAQEWRRMSEEILNGQGPGPRPRRP